MADVITTQEALEWVGRTLGDSVDESAMAVVASAVNQHLSDLYPRAVLWPSDTVRLAALLLASRWYSRRNSPDGLVGFGEMGGTSIRNLDPDIRDMLKRYRSLAVG